MQWRFRAISATTAADVVGQVALSSLLYIDNVVGCGVRILFFIFLLFFPSNFCIISFLDKTALSRYSVMETSVEAYIREAPVSQPLTPLYPSCPQSSVSLQCTSSCLPTTQHHSRCSNDLIERKKKKKRKKEK